MIRVSTVPVPTSVNMLLLSCFLGFSLVASSSAFIDFDISCGEFTDYALYNFSGSCFHDPDINSNPASILRRHAKHYQEYEVKTEDGYYLTLFRIERKNPKGVVVLQHPLTTDSVVWMVQGNESLAFVLWNAGYDVWMPNHRGTRYSQKHARLSPDDYDFWDFGFHEIGVYDYKANIDFISKMTGRNDLVFIGHSLSTSASIVYAALYPEQAKASVKVFIELSPIVYFKHSSSLFLVLGHTSGLLKMYSNFFHSARLLSPHSLVTLGMNSMQYFPFKKIVVYIMALLGGWTPDEYNPVHFNRMASNVPQEFSFKCIFHYAQMLSSQRFSFYDYGKWKNLELYNVSSPPDYPLKNIKVPIYVVSSIDDTAGTAEDAEMFYNDLSEEAKKYGKLVVSGLNHFDFHFGRSRMEKVYDPILNMLNKIL